MTREEANNILMESAKLNDGPWVQHCLTAAKIAETLAENLDLDKDKAYTYGLLHDIGRRAGNTAVRHIMDGYNYLKSIGHEDIGRYCLTHSFMVKDMGAILGAWDLTNEETEFLKDYLDNLEFNLYDKIIQLSDYMGLPGGPTLIDRRILHVYLRYDFDNQQALNNWRALFKIQEEIEEKLGYSIYKLFPEVEKSISENLVKDVLEY
ncbi:MAG: HD domain-containing protein [Oscillospiraceae bacterium]|nr:HD domain-containing protein [Oscillospiraceae bacterium]